MFEVLLLLKVLNNLKIANLIFTIYIYINIMSILLGITEIQQKEEAEELETTSYKNNIVFWILSQVKVLNQSLIIDLFYFVFSQTFESGSFLYIEINQSLIIYICSILFLIFKCLLLLLLNIKRYQICH